MDILINRTIKEISLHLKLIENLTLQVWKLYKLIVACHNQKLRYTDLIKILSQRDINWKHWKQLYKVWLYGL